MSTLPFNYLQVKLIECNACSGAILDTWALVGFAEVVYILFIR